MGVLGASADSVALHALTVQPRCIQCPPPVAPWQLVEIAALKASFIESSILTTNYNAAPTAAAAACANRRRC